MEDKNGNPNDMEWGEIGAEISIIMYAGSGTTAIQLCNLIEPPPCKAVSNSATLF
jgi:hypothetical protein